MVKSTFNEKKRRKQTTRSKEETRLLNSEKKEMKNCIEKAEGRRQA